MPTILIIDDDSAFREIIAASLRAESFDVLEATDGSTGVRLARQRLPDLIISDVKMAESDGFEALAELRDDRSTAAIPFIFMTGQADQSVMRRGMEQGADDYLVKPVAISALVAAVDARLKKQAAVRSEAERRLSELRTQLGLMLPHELNTPLAGILSLAELLASGAELEKEQLQSIGRNISQAAGRLQRLIQHFLLNTQMELLGTDRRELDSLRQRETPDPGSVIQAVAMEKAREYQRANDLDLGVTTAPLSIGCELFRRIIEELVDNAFKFSPPGSRVGVHSQVQPPWYQVRISDQGRGMTPGQITDVGAFIQFERRLYQQHGAGLGLAISRRLLELHGGELRIESQPGSGTTMLASLPLDAK